MIEHDYLLHKGYEFEDDTKGSVCDSIFIYEYKRGDGEYSKVVYSKCGKYLKWSNRNSNDINFNEICLSEDLLDWDEFLNFRKIRNRSKVIKKVLNND